MLSINFVGDVSFGRKIGETIAAANGRILQDEVVHEFTSADLVCGNLEAPIVSRARLTSRGSLFAPDVAKRYLNLFSVVNLANNHISDCGDGGVDETLEALRQAGVQWTGLVERGKAAVKVASCRAGGDQILFVGCTTQALVSSSTTSRYALPLIESPEVLAQIKTLAASPWPVVLLCHAGFDYVPEPPPELRRLLREYVEAGVAAVITHHPHVLGGPESVRAGSLTWHSLGDFIFDGLTRLRRRGGILRVTMDCGQVTDYRLIPTQIDQKFCVCLAEADVAHAIDESVQQFAARLQAPDYDRRYSWMFLKSLALFQWLRLAEVWRERGVARCMGFAFRRVPYLLSYGQKLLGGGIR